MLVVGAYLSLLLSLLIPAINSYLLLSPAANSLLLLTHSCCYVLPAKSCYLLLLLAVPVNFCCKVLILTPATNFCY